jgi:hypothetical protein
MKSGSGPVARPQGMNAATARHAAGERLHVIGVLRSTRPTETPRPCNRAAPLSLSKNTGAPRQPTPKKPAASSAPLLPPSAQGARGISTPRCPRSERSEASALEGPAPSIQRQSSSRDLPIKFTRKQRRRAGAPCAPMITAQPPLATVGAPKNRTTVMRRKQPRPNKRAVQARADDSAVLQRHADASSLAREENCRGYHRDRTAADRWQKNASRMVAGCRGWSGSLHGPPTRRRTS